MQPAQLSRHSRGITRSHTHSHPKTRGVSIIVSLVAASRHACAARRQASAPGPCRGGPCARGVGSVRRSRAMEACTLASGGGALQFGSGPQSLQQSLAHALQQPSQQSVVASGALVRISISDRSLVRIVRLRLCVCVWLGGCGGGLSCVVWASYLSSVLACSFFPDCSRTAWVLPDGACCQQGGFKRNSAGPIGPPASLSCQCSGGGSEGFVGPTMERFAMGDKLNGSFVGVSIVRVRRVCSLGVVRRYP